MTIDTSGATVLSGRPRHGLYGLIAFSLALLISVLALVRPALHPIFWFAGRLFRQAAVTYRIARGYGASVTAPYLIAEAILNVFTWSLLIYAAERWFHHWRVRNLSATPP